MIAKILGVNLLISCNAVGIYGYVIPTGYVWSEP